MLRFKKGRSGEFNVPYGGVPVHCRGGAIAPIQRTSTAPKVTRNVRYTPVTLVVTLPARVMGGCRNCRHHSGSFWAAVILEEPCAAPHLRNAGKFVSCGMLYIDQDDLNISANNTLQVWYSLVWLLCCCTCPAGNTTSSL